jgi:hypothetical protein
MPNLRFQNVNVQLNNNLNNLDININNHSPTNPQRDSITSNAELKAVLAKYIKSKLPTQLKQKNPCLYSASPDGSCNKIEYAAGDCKSVDVKVNIRQDDLPDLPEGRLNSKALS